MILEIEFTFPNGRFHGEEWEWPPAPARVFQALVAGTHQGAHGLIHREVRDAALHWLETLPPPVILAGAATLGCEGLDNYVPNNDDRPDHVRAAKVLAVHAFPADSVVAYRWTFDSNAPGAARHADATAAMASLVTHLGQTTDSVFARGRVRSEANPDGSAAAPDPRAAYLPNEDPGGAWRVPSRGFLELCQRRYPRPVSTQPPDYTNSRQVNYAPQPDGAAGASAVPMAFFEMLQPDGEGPRRFDARDVRQPSGMVRGALLTWAKRPYVERAFGPDTVARLLAGHRAAGDPARSENNGHFGVVPLPSLNQAATADGDFRRVALIGWGINTKEERELFEEAVQGLHGAKLQDEGDNRRVCGVLSRSSEGVAAHWRAFWCGASSRWRSVTPVVLPGCLRPGRAPEALLARALVQAGYGAEEIVSVAAFSGPLVPHTRPARDYRLRDYLDKTPRRQVEILFQRPVAGPLVLGRGRYAGLGLCLPLPHTNG
jgi:CRISPR-associated protein Csb2